MSAIKNRSSKNQSRPIASPPCGVSLICTLDPPKAVAAMASNIPVNAKTFFLRLIEEMITASDSYNTVDLGRYFAILSSSGEHSADAYLARRGGTKVTPGFGSTLLSMYGHAVTELTENGLVYALMVPLCDILKANTSPKVESVAADPQASIGTADAP